MVRRPSGLFLVLEPTDEAAQQFEHQSDLGYLGEHPGSRDPQTQVGSDLLRQDTHQWLSAKWLGKTGIWDERHGQACSATASNDVHIGTYEHWRKTKACPISSG